VRHRTGLDAMENFAIPTAAFILSCCLPIRLELIVNLCCKDLKVTLIVGNADTYNIDLLSQNSDFNFVKFEN
jgi:hypothetical protein